MGLRGVFSSRRPTTCSSIRMTAEIFEFWLKLCLLVAATELMAATSGYNVIDSVYGYPDLSMSGHGHLDTPRLKSSELWIQLNLLVVVAGIMERSMLFPSLSRWTVFPSTKLI